jgi:hypothetical protein
MHDNALWRLIFLSSYALPSKRRSHRSAADTEERSFTPTWPPITIAPLALRDARRKTSRPLAAGDRQRLGKNLAAWPALPLRGPRCW